MTFVVDQVAKAECLTLTGHFYDRVFDHLQFATALVATVLVVVIEVLV